MSSNAPKGSKSVALVATASVDGYLRNASKRQRVPAAEGGRGTRRKLAMVTSASARAPTTELEVSSPAANLENVDADADEWDEVDLPQVPTTVKKQEMDNDTTVVKSDVAYDENGGAVKAESGRGSPAVKSEGMTSSAAPSTEDTINYVKAELINVDADVPDDAPIMDGAQLPLVGQPRSSGTWRQRDPAYEAMMEQRDLLAAQRRSERIQRVCESLFEILAVLLRARLMWRESSHPKFVKMLLRLHLAAGGGERKRARIERNHVKADARYVFLKAVLDAKALVAESTQPQFRKLALAPAWVSCGKDTVQSKTSSAVKTLLDTINRYFKLAAALAVPAPGADASPSVSAVTPSDALDPAAAPAPAEQDFSDWSVGLVPKYLSSKFAELHGQVHENTPVELPHPVYFSLLFLALARVVGLRCRLVIARRAARRKEEKGASSSTRLAGEEDEPGEEDRADDDVERVGRRRPLQKLSIFEGREKRKANGETDGTAVGTEAQKGKRKRSGDGDANNEELKSKKLPTSCFWVEVWSPERESFLSVNPCQGCATLWGAPYTFSVSGHVAVDATPRYVSRYSTAYAYGRRLGTCQQLRFLWHDKLAWDDSREVSEVIRATFNEDDTHTSVLTQRQQQRERRQLHSLMYSEVVPTTLSALHRHPLYVIESDLARHEGIYPKDANTTVGSVKGHMVYKRSAIVSLRSRDGWLREGRSLLTEDQVPYKIVAPPASRPFVAPSTFFGRWQTRPFEPLPLVSGDPPTIPHHGRTSWYILLDKPVPAGLAHMTQPQIARVARRMRLDFGLAVTGFERRRTDEHRRGHWETLISGIVVRELDSATLLHAYEEWMQLVQEQEAAKRRHRAFHWWLLLSQRLLSLKRLQDQYARGLGAGTMPVQ
ncbi:putative Dna-repair protein [Leptomonas pyrrhocoris]|uniref:Putative Dna-repair protein n=1 Tax=Leptomonas pyrrhocoris TaxID=157538 RepID=A0A0M9GAW9_LEPPY|nr:putative Dna-repair protein [Leptomonas pyrrhocoris]KPA86399.1 putative Dna-repair protein [Leptomonas pyrrhocoris]|eukprot:XP_015664838.1 putative Dna-repair protein [Leptomonas pyrrhocoris]